MFSVKFDKIKSFIIAESIVEDIVFIIVAAVIFFK